MIPTKVHGVLDYLVGAALILAPYIFGFAAVGGAAVVIPQILGIGLIVYSVFTDYELGLVHALPMKGHLALDFIASAFLALSPWLFGFADGPWNQWVPHLAVGVVVILVVLASSSTPSYAGHAGGGDGGEHHNDDHHGNEHHDHHEG